MKDLKRWSAAGFSLLLISAMINVQGQSGRMKFPEIRIYISGSQFNRLRTDRGIKMELKKAVMLLDRDTVIVKELHSRGLTSLQFGRKSMPVDLQNAVALNNSNQIVKRFDLVNLAVDQNLWHNRWAFLSLAQLHIFPLYNTFCKVWINGQHQGIYLLVEKPNCYMDKVKIHT